MKIGGPTADLRTRLQTALGSGYVLGRELSGGGMARVFVAEDVRLARTIVVKVTAPACSTRARWWALIECVNKPAAVHHDERA